MPPGHHHRASGLKQSNKRNKRSKASKRSLNRLAGGKINKNDRKSLKAQSNTSSNKANRLNEARQRRDKNRIKLLEERRRVVGDTFSDKANSGSVVPRIIGIISLSRRERDFEEEVRSFLVKSADGLLSDGNEENDIDVKNSTSVTARYDAYKKNGVLTILTNSSAFRGSDTKIGTVQEFIDEETEAANEDASLIAALDLCRVCDMVTFLIDGSEVDGPGDFIQAGMSVGGKSQSTTKTIQQQEYDHLISPRGDRILSAVKAQGLPTPLVVLVNYEKGNNGNSADDETMSLLSCQSFKSARRSAIKQRLELKKYVSRFAMTEFGENSKVADLDIPNEIDVDDTVAMRDDSNNDELSSSVSLTKSKKILPDSFQRKQDLYPTRAALIRTFCFLAVSPPKWVHNMPRAYILSDGGDQKDTLTHNGKCGHSYDSEKRELKITGYVRGKVPLDVHNLVHVPGIGTFPLKCIQSAHIPKMLAGRTHQTSAKNKPEVAIEERFDETNLLAEADPMKRESLEMFATPDALEGEQNLVGFDEDHNFDEESNEEGNQDGFQKGISRPTGWSDYQNAWLDAIGDEDIDDEHDNGELAFALNQKSNMSVVDPDDMDDANDITADERKALLEQRRSAQKDDLMFPDEVEINEGEHAQERLARFRSLKSFRKSYWDPKENLPESYASIYHFSSFKATQGDVMADMKDLIEAANFHWDSSASKSTDDRDDLMKDEDDNQSLHEILEGCVPSGAYVTITLEEVPPSAAARLKPSTLLVAVSLLPHENKVSVLHMGLSQTSQCDPCNVDEGSPPVKSKDILTFRCGWRTWQGRPIFSQNNLNSDKHKFERFLPTDGAFFAASIFGPVTYTPCPVLVFREPHNQFQSADNDSTLIRKREMIALGSMIGSDADRIIIKRVVLTGFPTRVHKRHATVKYMFYDPEDVKVRKDSFFILILIFIHFFVNACFSSAKSGSNLQD